jgi:putative CocE/NonD family hydrolase
VVEYNRKKIPTAFDHVGEMVRFFDAHLRERDGDVMAEAPVHYFTMGEERWKAASAWPPPGTTTRTLHLAAGGVLAESGSADAGADEYAVDFGVGTGVHSRFGKHLSGGRFPSRYLDRAKAAPRLLTYTSAPLPDDLEVTGHPLATLFVSSTASDGAFLLYVDDVGPDGVVHCVTDGALRGSARQTSPAPYWLEGPFHPYRRDGVEPMVPGEVVELAFDLFPVSWLFRAGHCIRVSIAGADKDNFQHIAEEQSPVITVYRGGGHPSRVEIPIVPRREEN